MTYYKVFKHNNLLNCSNQRLRTKELIFNLFRSSNAVIPSVVKSCFILFNLV